MKDTVDELIQRLYDGYDYEIHEEILRRFAELEKENELLRCCGNCTYESSGQCFVDSDDDIINKTCGNLRCESWESDLMTKSERWISREDREK
jgi:hypothetical protein